MSSKWEQCCKPTGVWGRGLHWALEEVMNTTERDSEGVGSSSAEREKSINCKKIIGSACSVAMVSLTKNCSRVPWTMWSNERTYVRTYVCTYWYEKASVERSWVQVLWHFLTFDCLQVNNILIYWWFWARRPCRVFFVRFSCTCMHTNQETTYLPSKSKNVACLTNSVLQCDHFFSSKTPLCKLLLS